MQLVITGASRGIGRVLANNLSASKMFLLHQIDDDNMKLTAAGMKCDFVTFKCDVCDEAQVKSVFDKIDRIDVLINNAGTVADSMVKDMTVEQWDRVIDVNLKGAFLCSKYAAAKMTRNSHIINISSVTSKTGIIGACNYAASKGGLESLTRALALELACDGILVNCISLGFFDIGLGSRLTPKVRDAALKRIPLHRFGDPLDIVKAIEFVISSGYLVGSTLNLSGGYHL